MRPELSAEQARVLAALAEKSITTPKYYPMTVNALMAACNQKNSRWPIMQLTEGQVGAALRDLEAMDLVAEEHGARVAKWRHRLTHQLLLKGRSQAVLLTLILRGPQTAAELRSHSAPLKGPADSQELNAVLEDLQDRAQPLLMLLPREAGRKEQRYAHLLCGEEAALAMKAADSGGRSDSVPAATLEALEGRIAALEEQLAELQERLQAS